MPINLYKEAAKIFSIHWNWVINWHSLGNYQEALTYHQKYLDIALQLGDKDGEEKHTAYVQHW